MAIKESRVTRGWGGSLYISIGKFLKAIGVNAKDVQVFVMVTEEPMTVPKNVIVITKERLDVNENPKE